MSQSSSRRKFLMGAAPAAGLATTGWIYRNELIRWTITHRENTDLQISRNTQASPSSCAQTAPQPEGPYHAQAPVRRDIREGKAGLALELDFQLLLGHQCAPATDTLIEIWHCDGAGEYSGHPKDFARKPWETIKRVGIVDPHNAHIEPINGDRFLRGCQVTDANGHASFLTIFPGWYDPRVPHIHIALSRGGQRLFTTQIYFDDAFANDIYAQHPLYRDHGLCPYRLANDPVLAANPKANGLLVSPEYSVDGLKAKAVLVFHAEQPT